MNKGHSVIFSSISRFFSRFFKRRQESRFSLAFLNVSQFTGVLNDNIYKLVLMFFLIELEGTENANIVLSAAGAIYVIPFLLFSSIAGNLADRYSKSRLILWIKACEIAIMIGVIVAFTLQSPLIGYTFLFFLSTHSAFFGPSKYGIIPELVPKSAISKANGLITSFTYLGMIIGTFLASFLTDMLSHHYILIGFFCLLIACVGFLSSVRIQYTPPKATSTIINWLFLKEILHTLKASHRREHLLVAMYGSSFFLFMGAFTQLNIIPFAIQSLNLSEVYGGYLFLPTALGIAFGAYLAGRASKKEIELGLSCLAGGLIGLFLICLALFSSYLSASVIWLVFLGIAGGLFVVPFDSYIQFISPENHRGHVIATTNFLSFCGVLLASAAIYLFNQVLGLNAAKSFALMGVISFLTSFMFSTRLSDLVVSYLSGKYIHKIYKVKINITNIATPSLFILTTPRLLQVFLLSGFFPRIQVWFIQGKFRRFPWFQNLFFSLHRFPANRLAHLPHQIKKQLKEPYHGCVLVQTKNPEVLEETVKKLREELDIPLYLVDVKRLDHREVILTLNKL